MQNAPTDAPALPLSDPTCPFHAVVRQQDLVVPLAAKLHIPNALMPLFPSESGVVCTKSAMEATIEARAVRLQIPTVGPFVLLLLSDFSAQAFAHEHSAPMSRSVNTVLAGVATVALHLVLDLSLNCAS